MPTMPPKNNGPTNGTYKGPKDAETAAQRILELAAGKSALDGIKSAKDLPDSPFVHAIPGGTDKTFAQIFGEIVWIFSQSPMHKSFFINDLEWMVMTPILLQQFRIFYDSEKPIGVALWAFVDEEVQTRMTAGGVKLRPQDWKSGPNLWLVDLIAPFGGNEIGKLRDSMIIDLKKNVFPEAPIKMRAAIDGKITTRVL